MPVKILFVDDEKHILESIERSLFDKIDEWDMAFATSGSDALEQLDEAPVDVIVSDMRMPGMDGATLLQEVKARHPDTIRFVLTGQVEEEAAFRLVDLAHQFLTKPCDPDLLQNLIERALSLRELLDNDSLKSAVVALDRLPSLPKVYQQLAAELNDPESSIQAVARIIGGDVAMCAKVLQLVNSAFFGLRNRVTDVTTAISYLGLDVIRPLVLAHHAFTECSKSRVPSGFDLEALSQHGAAVAVCARAILTAETDRKKIIQDGFAAGMLHDLGKLILATSRNGEYAEVIALVRREKIACHVAEQRVLGLSHPAVGAYLLGLWGLPDPIVEAVAFHHSPRLRIAAGVDLPGVIHVADSCVRQRGSVPGHASPEVLDQEYVHAANLGESLPAWEQACHLALESTSND